MLFRESKFLSADTNVDFPALYVVDTTAGPRTLGLPFPANQPLEPFGVLNIGPHPITVTARGDGAKINESSSYIIVSQFQFVTFVPDGNFESRARWRIQSDSGSTDERAAPSFETLTDGATITWGFRGRKTSNAMVTIAGNRVLSITGLVSGATGTLKVVQGAGGNKTLALPAGSLVINGGEGVLALSTAAGAIDILTFVYDGDSLLWNVGLNYS